MDSLLIAEILKKEFPQFKFICKKNKVCIKKGIFFIIIIISKGEIVDIHIASWIKLFVGYITAFFIKGLYVTVSDICKILNKNNIKVQILYEK